jgi:hypothetical protein
MSLFHQTDVRVRQNQVVRRRDFLKGVSLAGAAAGSLGAVAGSGLTDVMAAGTETLRRQGKSCILVWLQGAPSQFETFDPKPDHDNGGETKAIDTSVAGIRIAENLPHTAKVADRLSIIRSLSTKEGNHQRATYMLHTSYVPTATVKHPTLGAVVSHEIVDPSCELPAFVRINGRGFGNGGGGGLLGTAYDPFDVGGAGRGPAGGPSAGGGTLRPSNTAPTTPEDRYRTRLGLLGRLEQAADNPAIAHASADHQKLYDKASRMILSPQMKAFDTAGEPEKIRQMYGSDDFGTGCLLARRLIETGVTCVEVGLGNWDTHDDNFNRCRTLCGRLDQPLAALIRDLEERGMLERTLVVVMGEFGRTPRINPRGGRDHYPRAFSAALAGCGVRGGQVIGGTDAGGDDVADGRMSEKDLFCSIYRALGINFHKEFMSPIGRPIKIVEGGAPVDALFG